MSKRRKKRASSAEAGSGRFRSSAVFVAGLAVVLGAAAAAWLVLRGDGVRTPIGDPNVVVITADTLRPDRLSTYGGPVESPNLGRLAASGVVFESAVASAPITLPSHATILTGRYPPSHGVRDNGGRALADSHDTLAEVLGRRGYRTAAFVSAFVLDERWGLAQGFDVYADELGDPPEGSNLASTQRPGGETMDEALAWLESARGRDGPFFAWVHLFDPHTPYAPPEPFRSRFEDSDAGRYDGEVAYVDFLVGRLVDWLEANELAESTVVAFVGDHGESLGEHGEETHGFFVYDATMRVPFIVRAPGATSDRGVRVAELVRTVDVLPTVLAAVGVSDVPESIDGINVLPFATGAEDGLALRAYGESLVPAHYGWSALRSLRTEDAHFIDAPRPELYDVRRDPEERENLARERAATVAELRAELDALESEMRTEPDDVTSGPTPLDADTEARLRALGYVGTAGALRAPSSGELQAPSSGELQDPKDKIQLFKRIRLASAAIDASDHETAIETLTDVLDEDPEIVEAHRLLGDAYLAGSQPENAVTSFRAALARGPEHPPAIFGLASAYQATGRLDEAAAGFERLVALGVSSSSAVLRLAQIYLEQEKYDACLDALESASVHASDQAMLERLRATAHLGKGELDAAERGFRAELEHDPSSFQAHFELARIAQQRGQSDEAVRHLEQAVDMNPRFALGLFYLANVELERGELQRAMDLAKQGIAARPDRASAPLGHLILADIYGRLGRTEDAARELETAKRLQ